MDFFDGRHQVVASVLRDGTCHLEADLACSRWAARMRQSLEYSKGDPLKIGFSATILTLGSVVALYLTSQLEMDTKISK